MRKRVSIGVRVRVRVSRTVAKGCTEGRQMASGRGGSRVIHAKCMTRRVVELQSDAQRPPQRQPPSASLSGRGEGGVGAGGGGGGEEGGRGGREGGKVGRPAQETGN